MYPILHIWYFKKVISTHRPWQVLSASRQDLRSEIAQILSTIGVCDLLTNMEDATPKEKMDEARKTAAQLTKAFGVSPRDLRPSLRQRFEQFGKRLANEVSVYHSWFSPVGSHSLQNLYVWTTPLGWIYRPLLQGCFCDLLKQIDSGPLVFLCKLRTQPEANSAPSASAKRKQAAEDGTEENQPNKKVPKNQS